MRVRVDLMISLDGFASTTDGTPDDPIGRDWHRLVAAFAATRTFRERVMHDTSGAGTTGVDDRFAAAQMEDVGVEIMGAGKFGLHTFPDDPDWRGWWGEEPPFRTPVLVLTHTPRETIEMANGTSFRFLSATPAEAMEQARALAGGKDIRVGGGPTMVRDFLLADLVDELHVAITPILLGNGVRLWDDLRGLESRFEAVTETSETGIVHVTFRR